MDPMLAQIFYNADDIEAVQSVKEAWDPIWTSVLDSVIFERLVSLGITIAGVAIAVWAVRVFRMLVDGQFIGGFGQIIYPTLVVILLLNNGSVLKNLTLYQRDIVNHVNDLVIQNMNLTLPLSAQVGAGRTLNISQIANGAVAYEEIKSRLTSAFNECASISGEQKKECFDQIFADYKPGKVIQESAAAAMPLSPTEAAAYGELYDKLLESYNQISTNPSGPSLDWFLSFIVSPALTFIGRPGDTLHLIQRIIATILTMTQIAFAHVFELTMLLTALLGPLAVGGAIIAPGPPLGSLFAWMIGFWSIALARVCLTLTQGIGLMIYAIKGVSFLSALGLILAIFAPLVSFALASGGGLAVFSSIMSMTTNVVVGAATGGLSLIGSVAKK